MPERVQKYLTHVSSFVTLSANTANVLTPIVKWTVPRGLAWVIPGSFPLVLKLQDSAGNEISTTSEIYFAIQVPSEPRKYFYIGAWVYYHPWADLDTSQQRDLDYEKALTVDLGVAFLPLQEEESFVVLLYSPDTISTSNTIIYVPYTERNAGEIDEELTYRREWLKV